MKRDACLALLFIGAIAVASPRMLFADNVENLCRRTIRLITQGDLQEAQSELDLVLQNKPKRENDRVILGWTLSKLSEQWKDAGDQTHAVADLHEALILDPDEAYWHSALARLLHAQGDAEAATKECSLAASLSPLDSGLAAGCGFLAAREIWDDDSYPALRSHTSQPQGGITAPSPAKPPSNPDYTDKARTARLQGIIVLWLVVGVQGDVEKIAVKKPIGLGLDQNALRTVRTWKFKPATRNGTPIPVRVEVEVTFRLF
jgi:TonB family protein